MFVFTHVCLCLSVRMYSCQLGYHSSYVLLCVCVLVLVCTAVPLFNCVLLFVYTFMHFCLSVCMYSCASVSHFYVTLRICALVFVCTLVHRCLIVCMYSLVHLNLCLFVIYVVLCISVFKCAYVLTETLSLNDKLMETKDFTACRVGYEIKTFSSQKNF